MFSQLDDAKDSIQHDILVIGSLVSDISCTYALRPDDDQNARPRQGSSNPATITQCVGGVAHNIALTAQYLGASVLLVSVVADDSAGEFLLKEVEKEGLSIRGIGKLGSSEEHGEVRTGQYVGNYNHDKEFIFGMADVKLMLHPETQNESYWEALISKAQPRIIVLDTTFSHTTLDIISKIAARFRMLLIVEPVSQPRAEDFPLTQTFQSRCQSVLNDLAGIMTPNAEELDAMFRGIVKAGLISEDEATIVASCEHQILSNLLGMTSSASTMIRPCVSKVLLLLRFVPVLIVTFGSEGCLLATRSEGPSNDHTLGETVASSTLKICGTVYEGTFDYYPPPHRLGSDSITSVNGAGDSLVGAVATEICAVLKRNGGTDSGDHHGSISWQDWNGIIERGQWSALATLQHRAAVSPALKDLDGFKDKMLAEANRRASEQRN